MQHCWPGAQQWPLQTCGPAQHWPSMQDAPSAQQWPSQTDPPGNTGPSFRVGPAVRHGAHALGATAVDSSAAGPGALGRAALRRSLILAVRIGALVGRGAARRGPGEGVAARISRGAARFACWFATKRSFRAAKVLALPIGGATLLLCFDARRQSVARPNRRTPPSRSSRPAPTKARSRVRRDLVPASARARSSKRVSSTTSIPSLGGLTRFVHSGKRRRCRASRPDAN